MKQGKIIFDKDVKVIGESAFEGFSSLTSITIPKSVQTIEDNAFKNCQNLSKVEYKGSYVDWLNIIKSNTSFDNINTNIVECNDREIHITLPNYFYIESRENSNNVNLGSSTWLYTKHSRVEYSIDKVNWNPLNINSYTLNKGEKMYFRCVDGNIEKDRYNSSSGLPLLKPSKTFNVGGDISTVIYGEENVQSINNEYAMYRLFISTKIVDASQLLLPTTMLTDYCYESMFENCTSLTTAPELPATTLADRCYNYMFRNCDSLTTAPELPATTLAPYCYYYMFADCTSLTTVPELPATTLATDCYSGMFSGCTSLIKTPELPATTLVEDCYSGMFSGCTSLIKTPELPAMTLATDCYRGMFGGCTSLIKAPELPATTLAEGCYYYMFYNCANLNYIKCLATDMTATNCTYNWVNGVSDTGTFIKHPNASWSTGESGIPSGWEVVDVDVS